MKAPAKSSGSSSPAASILKPSSGREPGAAGALALFSLLAEHDHEQVSVYHEPSCGYRGIIAIHSTVAAGRLVVHAHLLVVVLGEQGEERDRKSTRLNSSHRW